MAAEVPNIAKGRHIELAKRVDDNDPTNSALILRLYKTFSTAMATLRDYDDAAALEGDAGVVVCDFTNYAQVVRTDADIAVGAPDDSGDSYDFDVGDITPLISSAGNGTNNTIAGAVWYYDPDTTGGTDADLIPIHIQNGISLTTNGSDINYTTPSGFLSAA